MPSTPRMIEIERKASQPGEPLSREEIAEWHQAHAMIGWPPKLNVERATDQMEFLRSGSTIDYSASFRYLDSPGWKARHG